LDNGNVALSYYLFLENKKSTSREVFFNFIGLKNLGVRLKFMLWQKRRIGRIYGFSSVLVRKAKYSLDEKNPKLVSFQPIFLGNSCNVYTYLWVEFIKSSNTCLEQRINYISSNFDGHECFRNAN
jgi:hypothetical protein